MNTPAPTLLDDTTLVPDYLQENDPIKAPGNNLMDLMYDGFYALFLLKNGSEPKNEANFVRKLRFFLNNMEMEAKKLNIPTEDVEAAKYAYCAAIDETMLRSDFAIRDSWARHPLQLMLFGDQLAGEKFFSHLESLRQKNKPHLQAMEIYHLCLLLGFQGRYLLESPEKLHYLTARLGEEIVQLKGKPAQFAPHSERPDHVANRLRTETPLWVIASVFLLLMVGAYSIFNHLLTSDTLKTLAAYNDIIHLAPHPATLIISLP